MRAFDRCANDWFRLGGGMGVGWAVFRNYRGHAKEILGDVTDYPRFFLMPPSAMIDADGDGLNIVTLLDPVSYTHLPLPTIYSV